MDARQSFFSVMVAFLVLNAITVGLRLFVRISKENFSYDDWATVVAMGTFILFCAFEFASLGYGYGTTEMKPEYDLVTAAKFFVLAQILYFITQLAAKISIALVLHRIACGPGPRYFLIGTMVFIFVSSTVCLLIFSLQCRPLSVAWGVGTGECLPGSTIANTGYAFSAIDIGLSWLYAAFPVDLLWGVQMSIKTKVCVTFLLGSGVVSCVATVVRLKYLVEVGNLPSLADPRAVELLLEATIYSCTEIGLAIFCASLAALKPLLKLLPFGTTSASTPSAKSGSGLASSYHMDHRGPAIRLHDGTGQSAAGSEDDVLNPSRAKKPLFGATVARTS